MDEFLQNICPRPSGPPIRAKGGAYVSFDPVEVLDKREVDAILDTAQIPAEQKAKFDRGMELARELVGARSTRDYKDDFQIAQTYLFFKAINDLRASSVLGKTGHSLQGFPLIRSAFETSELMDYLERNRAAVDDYLAAAGAFKRNLDWIRRELPHTTARSVLFDVLNWMTHPNFEALAIYGYRDVPGTDDRVIHAGPFVPRLPAMSPIFMAVTFVSYPIRVLYRCDREVVPDDWTAKFDAFDRESGNFYEPA